MICIVGAKQTASLAKQADVDLRGAIHHADVWIFQQNISLLPINNVRTASSHASLWNYTRRDLGNKYRQKSWWIHKYGSKKKSSSWHINLDGWSDLQSLSHAWVYLQQQLKGHFLKQYRNIINLDLFSHDSYVSFLYDVPKQWLEIGLQMGGRVQGQVGETSFINKRSNLKHLTERFS